MFGAGDGDPGEARRIEILRASRRRASARLAEDAELRAALASVADLAFVSGAPSGRTTTLDYMRAAFSRYADRPCLGERRLVPASDGGSPVLLPEFQTRSYGEIWARASQLASAWAHQAMVAPGDRIALAGFASIDLVVAELACLQRGAVVIPLQTSASPEDLAHIVDEAGARWLIASCAALPSMLTALSACSSIEGTILIDAPDEAATALGKVHTIDALESLGRVRGLVEPARPGRELPPDPTLFVLYTSGSTGRPKGVVHTDSRWQHVLREALTQPRIPIITVGYLPLCHLAGHHSVFHVMMRGGATYFVPRSDMSTLFEDLRLVRPTVVTLIPRVSMMIYQHFQTELQRRAGSATLDSPAASALMEEMRERFLGNRLFGVGTGMAPTAPEVMAFLERCFEVPIANTYGSTEMGPVTVNDRVQPWVEYKLVDVPELGYRTSDRPFPRGELLVRSSRESPGYFHAEQPASAARDAEGYLSSGDIVEERGTGHVVWIDRKNDVLRLGNGEFVSISRLEDLYLARSPFLAQVYLYGSPRRASLLAVLVPNHAAISAAGYGALDDTSLRALLRAEIDRIAQEQRLPPHEVPRAFLLEPAFTTDNGLLTEAGKLRRPRLRAHYGHRLEALDLEIEARQVRGLDDALHASGSVADRIRSILAATLGLPSEALTGDHAERSFVGLGGDSLMAVRFAALVEQACGAAPQVASVLDRSMSLARLLRSIEERLDSGAPFAAIHGRGASVVRASDLTLARVLPEALSGQLVGDVAAPRTILLTGANGFLGRFLLLELIARLAQRDGELVCIVRGADDDAARQRLQAAFSSTDLALRAALDAATASGRLSVYAGDLMQPRLGLTAARHDELSERIDAIVHAGALVNHALSYAELFEPNVLGTAQVMRLAIQRRRKSIHFISSTAVLGGLRRSEPVRETELAAALWPRRAVGGADAYAVGYGTSKWACEILLEALSRELALPVTVFRCGLLLAHRRYLGQLNEDDLMTRLLRGILDTKLAPTSFFASPAAVAPFDGVPVDFAAAAIASIALEANAGFSTYHPGGGDESPSLDRLLEWIERDGHALRRLPYGEWLAAFRTALEALDEPQRRRSALPVLHAWAHPIFDQLGIDSSKFRARLASDSLPSSSIPSSSITESYFRELLHALRPSHAP